MLGSCISLRIGRTDFFHILYHTPNNQHILLTHSEAAQAAEIVIVMLIFMPSVLFHFALYILTCVSRNLSSPWMEKICSTGVYKWLYKVRSKAHVAHCAVSKHRHRTISFLWGLHYFINKIMFAKAPVFSYWTVLAKCVFFLFKPSDCSTITFFSLSRALRNLLHMQHLWQTDYQMYAQPPPFVSFEPGFCHHLLNNANFRIAFSSTRGSLELNLDVNSLYFSIFIFLIQNTSMILHKLLCPLSIVLSENVGTPTLQLQFKTGQREAY